jgi:hypothetical protein
MLCDVHTISCRILRLDDRFQLFLCAEGLRESLTTNCPGSPLFGGR